MVRVVAAPDDAVLAHEARQCRQRVFVDLEADGALPGEVLRRAQRHVRAEPAEGLRLLVEAFEPEGGPASRGLQEEEPEPRVVFQGPERHELGASEHRLERVGHGVEEERVERPVRPERRDDHRAALVNADGHVELLGRIPHHVVGGVGQGASQAGVGADESGHEAELGDGATQLACRGGRILQRHHGGPEEPARIGGAVVRQPVVVGRGEGHRRRPVLHRREVQPDRRVQHGLVDALAVHVAQTGHRVGSARHGVGQGSEGPRVVERGTRAGEGAQRHGQDLGVPDDHVFVARPIGTDARPVPLRHGDPGRVRFDDMAVGVDDGSGAWRERKAPVPRHGCGVRQSSTSGSRWRKRRPALPPATARSSSSGRAPHVAASTLLGVGPGRIGVRVVALHHDVVDADDVALCDGRRVVNGAEPEVAPQHLTRQEVRGPGGALAAGRRMTQDVIGPVHQHRDPADPTLGERHLEIREAKRHAGPQPFARSEEGVHGEQRGQQLERRIRRGQGGP